jgi:hypothetical protein
MVDTSDIECADQALKPVSHDRGIKFFSESHPAPLGAEALPNGKQPSAAKDGASRIYECQAAVVFPEEQW